MHSVLTYHNHSGLSYPAPLSYIYTKRGFWGGGGAICLFVCLFVGIEVGGGCPAVEGGVGWEEERKDSSGKGWVVVRMACVALIH